MDQLFEETIPSHFWRDDILTLKISAKRLYDVIVRHFISDETTDGFRNSVMRLLTRENYDTYLLTINNSMKFGMVVRLVGKIQSLTQTQDSRHVAREVANNPNLTAVTEQLFRHYLCTRNYCS